MTYTVTILSSGEQFTVETGETILQAGFRQGIKLPYGCHGGLCGVCVSRIIAGHIVYPEGMPPALADEEDMETKGLCCVGFPISDLVIEPVNAGEDWEPWE
jgi:CDP-4-dehydro-6-deoxyglucose reductase